MNIFTRLFNKKESKSNNTSATIMLNSRSASSPINAYENDIYRSAVDSIARNVAKLKGVHVCNNKQGDYLTTLLQQSPNEFMTAYDLLYKITTHYYNYNNAFILIDRNANGKVTALYPIDSTNAEFMTDSQNTLLLQFVFEDGTKHIFDYDNIIHLRRHFSSDKLLGSTNGALIPALELAQAQNEGIINAIEQNANIKGVLEYKQLVPDERLNREKEAFIKEFFNMQNNGGVVITDPKRTYTPIKQEQTTTISAEDVKAVKTKIYDYLGISESIVNSTYTEDQFAAFYESVIEPFALQLSLEFTKKIFTERERRYNNKIRFESGRLQFSSVATKVKMIETLVPCGLLSINQALEILNLPAVQDGNKRLQTLNLIDINHATEYQLQKRKEGSEEGWNEEAHN